MVGNCTDKRSKEEVLYWKSLNPVFKVDLSKNFRSKLEIPLYFSENVKGKLPRKVTLKGPGVDIDTWEVLVTTTDNITSFIGEGWRSFVTDFSLEDDDTLVFKYKNNSYFKVTVINGKTSCERESSHFVTKPDVADVQEPEQAKVDCNWIHQTDTRKRKYDSEEEDTDDVVILEPHNFQLDEEKIQFGKASVFAKCIKKDPEQLVSSKTTVEVGVKKEVISSLSNNKTETEEHVKRACRMAKHIQASLENSFYVTLSRTSVSGSSMKQSIPKQWWKNVIKSEEGKCIQLRSQARSYDCYGHYNQTKKTASISSGWKEFVESNSLKQNDCCVFNLETPWQDNDCTICLNVQIIRAGESEDRHIVKFD